MRPSPSRLVVDGVGLFPDAPTSRGAKHMRSLEHAVRIRLTLLPWYSSCNAATLYPSPQTTDADPEFARVFREALAKGVQAYCLQVRHQRVCHCLVQSHCPSVSDAGQDEHLLRRRASESSECLRPWLLGGAEFLLDVYNRPLPLLRPPGMVAG